MAYYDKDVMDMIMMYKRQFDDYENHKIKFQPTLDTLRRSIRVSYLKYGDNVVIIYQDSRIMKIFKICRECGNFVPWRNTSIQTQRQFCPYAFFYPPQLTL